MCGDKVFMTCAFDFPKSLYFPRREHDFGVIALKDLCFWCSRLTFGGCKSAGRHPPFRGLAGQGSKWMCWWLWSFDSRTRHTHKYEKSRSRRGKLMGFNDESLVKKRSCGLLMLILMRISSGGSMICAILTFPTHGNVRLFLWGLQVGPAECAERLNKTIQNNYYVLINSYNI